MPSGPVAASFWADVPYFLPRQDPEGLLYPVAASIVLFRTFLHCPHTLADSVTFDVDHRMPILLSTRILWQRIMSYRHLFGHRMHLRSRRFILWPTHSTLPSRFHHARLPFSTSCSPPNRTSYYSPIRFSLTIVDLSVAPICTFGSSFDASPSASENSLLA